MFIPWGLVHWQGRRSECLPVPISSCRTFAAQERLERPKGGMPRMPLGLRMDAVPSRWQSAVKQTGRTRRTAPQQVYELYLTATKKPLTPRPKSLRAQWHDNTVTVARLASRTLAKVQGTSWSCVPTTCRGRGVANMGKPHAPLTWCDTQAQQVRAPRNRARAPIQQRSENRPPRAPASHP